MSNSNVRPYRIVANKLAKQIEKGVYPLNSKLPAERSLAEELKVSRPIIREAIIALEILGLVEVRPGSGIYVTKQVNTKSSNHEGKEKVSIFELLEARKIIEASIVALAAKSIGKDQLRRLQEVNKKLASSLEDSAGFDEADREFHSILAEASQNSLLEKIQAQLWQHRLESDLWRSLEEKVGAKKLRKTALKDHLAITKALESGKANKASKAMTKHLNKMIEIILNENMGAADEVVPKRLLKAVA